MNILKYLIKPQPSQRIPGSEKIGLSQLNSKEISSMLDCDLKRNTYTVKELADKLVDKEAYTKFSSDNIVVEGVPSRVITYNDKNGFQYSCFLIEDSAMLRVTGAEYHPNIIKRWFDNPERLDKKLFKNISDVRAAQASLLSTA
jgi:hypothetical protein